MLAVVARLTQDGFESQSDGERELRLPPPLQSPPRSTPRATTILTSKLKPPGPFDRVLGSSAYASGVGERPKPKGSQVSFADDSAFKPRRARSDTPVTPFPSSSPRRGDDEATPRVLAAAFALESIAERLKMRCVPSFLRVSPSLPPSHSCAPFSRRSLFPLLAARAVPSRSPPPRARTTRTAPPTPSHPRRNPNPSRTFLPPRGVALPRDPVEAAPKPPPAVFATRPRRNLLRGHRRKRQRRTVSGGEARARQASETRSRTRPGVRVRARGRSGVEGSVIRARRWGLEGRGNLFQARSRVGDLEPHVGRRAQRASRDGPHGVETRDRES